MKGVEFLSTELRVGLTGVEIARTATDEARRKVLSGLPTLKAELQKLSEGRAQEGHPR